MKDKKLLFLIEPAPYVMDFCKAFDYSNRNDVEVYFLGRKSSQPWAELSTTQARYKLLSDGTLATFRCLWYLLSRNDICLVHLSGWCGTRILFILFSAWWRSIPIFVESDTQLHPPRTLWIRTIKRLVYPLLFRLPFRFLPAGSRQAMFLRHYGVKPEKIVIHQMTVDVGRISRRIDELRRASEEPRSSQTCRFLFVGRLEPRKGLVSLLEAYRLCCNQQDRLELIIVGEGSMRSEIEAATLKQPGLRYLGWLEGENLIRTYAMADIFICPSLIEPWGLVVNEAMAAGLPVIVTDKVGCADDLVRNGKNGFVVSSGDPVGLASKMLLLATDPSKRQSMGQESRNIISNWTIEDQARIIQAAWSEIKFTHPC